MASPSLAVADTKIALIHPGSAATYVLRNMSHFIQPYRLAEEIARIEHALNDPIFKRAWDYLAKKTVNDRVLKVMLAEVPLKRVGIDKPHDLEPANDHWLAELTGLKLSDALKLRALLIQSIIASKGNPSHDVIIVEGDTAQVNNDPTMLVAPPRCEVDGVEFGGEGECYPGVYWVKRMLGFRAMGDPRTDHALICMEDNNLVASTRILELSMVDAVIACGEAVPCVAICRLLGAAWGAFSDAYDLYIGERKVPKPLLENRERKRLTAEVKKVDTTGQQP